MEEEKKITTDHFRQNIFEAYSHYTVWKVIAFSKNITLVGEEMAEKYVEVQTYHNAFFAISERASLMAFVMLVLHPFDTDHRSFSLYQVDNEKTRIFVEKNENVIKALRLVRNKVFAHSDKPEKSGSTNTQDYPLPSIEKLDQFFVDLTDFYNDLCREVDQSFTIFDNAKDLKHDIDSLFMNIYRGEKARKTEIDIEYNWSKNKKKISEKI